MMPELQPESTSSEAVALSLDSSLQAAIGAFEKHMDDEGFAVNTQKAFLSDLRLLGRYLGIGQPIGDIATQNLNDFLNWLVYERGVPCSPKSYARRVTTLKVFFGWLYDSHVLLADPSANVIQLSVTSPLASPPTDAEVARALAVTEQWRQEGYEGRKPDARPHLLLTLLLETGIKKGEAMAIVPNHVDRSNSEEPFLFVRYKNPRLRYKERKIPISADWLKILDEYLAQYRPQNSLFTCTARNLEYLLGDIAEAAAVDSQKLSFQNLRWYSALVEYRQGGDDTAIRQRLGLSKITWRESKAKLEKLHSQADSGSGLTP
jgi:integrase/recombinase XerD